MDAIIKKLIEGRHLKEEFDPMFDEDLKKYEGKLLKELLVALSGLVKIDIHSERPTHYGDNGFSGRVNGVPWHYSDLVIKKAAASDNRFVDVYIEV